MTEQPSQSNRGEALGLPPGSVRALLALAVVVAYVGLCVWQTDIPSLKDIAIMAVSFYFGSKIK